MHAFIYASHIITAYIIMYLQNCYYLDVMRNPLILKI